MVESAGAAIPTASEARLRGRVTQLDIARVAGVHNTTVSLSLRNSPAIPLATRQRIQAVAAELGYRPDPALQALASYRKALSSTQRTEILAYITTHSTRWGWRTNASEDQYYIGAQRRATERGYQLEHFWLNEPGMNPRRLSQVLFNRGIAGVILASHQTGRAPSVDLTWDRFSAIQIGAHPGAPMLHSVTNDREGAIRMAMQEALAAGYRRPGLIVPERWDTEVDRAWSLGFLTEQIRQLLASPVPIFHPDLNDRSTAASGGSGAFRAWFAEHRPDVVLSFRPLALDLLATVNVHAPEEVAFIDLNCDAVDASVAGVHQHCGAAGAVAVDLLASLLQQNLRGIPAVATTTFVTSLWQPGASLPRLAGPDCGTTDRPTAAILQGACAAA